MSDNPIIPPVNPSAASSADLHPADAENLAAVQAAGITAPSQAGSFAPPSNEELAARVEKLERDLAYLIGTYFREMLS